MSRLAPADEHRLVQEVAAARCRADARRALALCLDRFGWHADDLPEPLAATLTDIISEKPE